MRSYLADPNNSKEHLRVANNSWKPHTSLEVSTWLSGVCTSLKLSSILPSSCYCLYSSGNGPCESCSFQEFQRLMSFFFTSWVLHVNLFPKSKWVSFQDWRSSLKGIITQCDNITESHLQVTNSSLEESNSLRTRGNNLKVIRMYTRFQNKLIFSKIRKSGIKILNFKFYLGAIVTEIT